MRSRFLPVILSNADVDLSRLVPRLVGTTPVVGWAFERVCRYYRARGCAAFFLTGRAESLHRDLQRSGAAHAYFVAHAPDGDTLTSRADPFFDAIACGDEAGARSIARHSPREARPGQEHLEDFLYVRLLMQRFFLGATDAEVGSCLAKFEAAVAEGPPSERLEVCRALLTGDGEAFHAAFLTLIDAHRAWYETGLQKGRIPEEVWAIDGCMFIEGLALLRLARAARLSIAEEYPLIPSLALATPRVSHEPGSWRTP
ncbi:Imm49 family immunity protein [Pyxidicoccus caerfyrddinensis]|uniref:Imm49 family immunity protein n=1 Tax=Pyxidicoccus caerfyrddinensis TaxID=2709663 RepID=UPI0013DB1351|nr:Imm49 family immunity protein [Pyxidicoccus caerfyrddinensis]